MTWTRRSAVSGILAAGLTFPISSKIAVWESRPGTAFGTTVRLSAAAASRMTAHSAIEAGYERLRAVEASFSLFNASSELVQLNRAGFLDVPSPLMREMLELCGHFWRLTEGAFDASVQPLYIALATHHVTPADLALALTRTGWARVTHGNKVKFQSPGMQLTFNGIAQGFAADLVLTALRANGASAAAIDTGEMGWDHRFEGEVPEVAIAHPRDPSRAICRVAVPSGFLATSGDYNSAFTPDFSSHHIVDPKTGESPKELAAVTVIAPSGAMADALSTAFLVAGREKAISMLDRFANVEAIFITKSCEIFWTHGLNHRITMA